MSEPRIPLCEPSLAGNEGRYLQECVSTGFVSSIGPFVERFERELAAAVGAKYAVACASGTAALHVAMRVVGVSAGDEVFVPSFTFVASANAVLYQGARCTLVDSERDTWNADPGLIAEEIARRDRCGEPLPRAIEIVHVLGQPADIEPVVALCAEHRIPLIEDAAEALGARYTSGPMTGRQVGTVGTVGCFSFNGNKIVTSGGGGMIVTDDPLLAQRAKHLTTQARVRGRAYMHEELGYNYRMTNVAAALGVAQLEQLATFLARKRAIAARYDSALGLVPGITLAPRSPFCEASCWLYSILLGSGEDPGRRDALLDALDAECIDARPLWTPLHRMPLYAGAPLLGSGAVASAIADSGLSLPCSAPLTAADQDRVIGAVTRFAAP